MKRFVWIIGLIFCITCTIQAKDRVIERPPFLAWSSNSIEVDKIVMSDTVTTVYIKAFYHPERQQWNALSHSKRSWNHIR